MMGIFQGKTDVELMAEELEMFNEMTALSGSGQSVPDELKASHDAIFTYCVGKGHRPCVGPGDTAIWEPDRFREER